jgi:acetyl esterase/lipase
MASSLRSKFWRTVLRKIFMETGLTIQAERLRSTKNSKYHLPFPLSVRVDDLDVDGLQSVSLSPADAYEKQVVLHLHGGGYVTGSIGAYLMLCIPMAKALRTRIILPEYRLAPEYPFPAALDDALKAYRWLLAQGYEGSSITLSGDSAGGGLCLATVQALRDAGEPLPGAVLCLSPWTDLTHSSQSHKDNIRSEVLLRTDMLRLWASYYAGSADLRNPLISPVFADFRGFPPLLILVDRGEILLDDARMVAERAKAAGVQVTLSVRDGLWHVWPIVGDLVPESGKAFDEMARFLGERVSGNRA